MLGLEQYRQQCGLKQSLLHLVKLRLADQRLRLLSGYALEGPARHRRGRAAALFAGRMEGMPILLRARTRGIDMDRGRDSDYQWPRAPTGYIKQFVRTSAKRNCLTSPSRWSPSIRGIICRLPDAPHRKPIRRRKHTKHERLVDRGVIVTIPGRISPNSDTRHTGL